MRGHFLILGYPRSATAWLANFLTHGRVFCGHELLAECRRPADLTHQLLDLPGQFAGSAETAGALIADRIFLPGLKIAVIWRKPEEVTASLARMGIQNSVEICQQLYPALLRAARLPNAVSIAFEHLPYEDTARALLEHVAPGEPFCRERWKMLSGFNVQITRARHHELSQLARHNATELLCPTQPLPAS